MHMAATNAVAPQVAAGWRNISAGSVIPSEGYCDQPYVVSTADGAWLCVMTTGRGVEGQHGQHVVALRSTDLGKTWSQPVAIEPADGPESSWVMPLRTPSGRIYAFYVHNTDNLREVISEQGPIKRVDTLGHYVFKYSDDGGRTWSARRYEVPMREMQVDRDNVYGGKVRFFWGVGKPMADHGVAYIGLSKVGAFSTGFMTRSEGIFLASDNILTESDPAHIHWTTLPDGEVGLRAPAGPLAEEHNLVALSDGSLYCTYRTVQGHSAAAYSRDGGHTWTPPAYMSYTPGGRLIKHPRAANFVRRFSNGKYLYWFHNHGGRDYPDRNPAWLCGGVEKDGFIHWSQPEIALYDDDPAVRMSYPDFIEANGRYFITETQKTTARVHEIPAALLETMWRQDENHTVATRGLVLDLPARPGVPLPSSVAAPRLPELRSPTGVDLRAGFSLDFWIRFDALDAGRSLLDARDMAGRGWHVVTGDHGTIRITINDGRTESSWACDSDLLTAGKPHHVAIIVDGGPKIITFVVDGVLCDGGETRQFGWGRFNPQLRSANGTATLQIAPSLRGQLMNLRVYDRYLLTSEAVGNWRAGLPRL